MAVAEEKIKIPTENWGVNYTGKDIFHEGDVEWNGQKIHYNITQKSVDTSNLEYFVYTSSESLTNPYMFFLEPNQTGTIKIEYTCQIRYKTNYDSIIIHKETIVKEYDIAKKIIDIDNKGYDLDSGYAKRLLENFEWNGVSKEIRWYLLKSGYSIVKSVEYLNLQAYYNSTISLPYIKFQIQDESGNVVDGQSNTINNVSNSASKKIYLNYNSTSEEVVYKGTLFGLDGKEYTYTITQSAKDTTEGLIQMRGVDGSGAIKTVFIDEKTEFYSPGNAFFFAKIINDGDVITSVSDKSAIIKFDNYGIGVYYYYGEWGGGVSGSHSAKLKTFYINGIKKGINITSKIDENNTLFFGNEFIDAVIRIPYIGMDISVSILEYPFTYDSDYFYSDASLNFLVYGNNSLFTINNNIQPLSVNREILTYDNAERYDFVSNFSCTTNENDVLNSYLSFDVLENTTSTYRDFFLPCQEKQIGLNVVQECYSKRRIYYGQNFREDFCNAIYGKEDEYLSYFALNNSEVIDATSFTYEIDYNENYFAIPKDIFDSISSSNENRVLVVTNDSYMWGNQEYILYKCGLYYGSDKNAIITINLKS